MPLRNATCPTLDERREWAADSETQEPVTDWDLVLSWRMEPGLLRLCVELAADPQCPKSSFFLLVLYQWVSVVARGQQFDALRPMYNEWLEVARGVANPVVKNWRHRARFIFQGIELFERERWWSGYTATKTSG
jgi:hypothetical protein